MLKVKPWAESSMRTPVPQDDRYHTDVINTNCPQHKKFTIDECINFKTQNYLKG